MFVSVSVAVEDIVVECVLARAVALVLLASDRVEVGSGESGGVWFAVSEEVLLSSVS